MGVTTCGKVGSTLVLRLTVLNHVDYRVPTDNYGLHDRKDSDVRCEIIIYSPSLVIAVLPITPRSTHHRDQKSHVLYEICVLASFCSAICVAGVFQTSITVACCGV
ncbi:hypothetical protein HYDPIDRAFT_110405 [Hydnomerulius pinastri MD-312]|nr:hypothetical protein HYDPIDRAFT_110405 [Hydnomerulius pinastri MD-312]